MNQLKAAQPDPEDRWPLRLPTAPHPPSNAPVVLLAEDDEDLRYVMEYTLNLMGYEVIACPDGQMAAEAFRAESGISLLMTDFEMPGKNGLELANDLTGLRPTLPVIIITGSTLSTQTMQEIQNKQWTYISKPCHMPSLSARLKELLSAA